ncbi:MAG: hypothetical protein IPG17_31520 [Sandaracinaceae bacterium]|nr:hypothetical protein [Sandaracinaceae bacterium]
MILSLPDGHCYGRMGVDEAEAFLRAQAEHRVHTPARLRGCAKDSAWVQAASVAYRMETDERGFDAVVGEQHTVSVGRTRHVTLATHRGAVRVEVEQELHAEALRPASCGEAPTPTTLWRATLAS